MAAKAKQQWPADKIERRKVADLVPYARNARTHSPEQIEKLVASINEWGWTVPVLVDEKGVIIAGHGRVMAAAELGLADVPVMVAVGWTEAQKQAYVIADNKLAEGGGWDEALLHQEIADLDAMGFDTTLTGLDVEPHAADLDPAHGGVKRVSVERVKDLFWIAVSGPLAHQAETLSAFKTLAERLPGLEVEIGTVNRDG